MTLDDRLDHLLAPAFLAYVAAEQWLSRAREQCDTAVIEAARKQVVLTSRQAASELHQFADAVAVEQPAWLPPGNPGPRDVQVWVQARHCRFLRGDPCEDMDLLHDIQDAVKHVELRPRASKPRQVTSDKAIVALQTGYGQLGRGKGKFGGAEQLVVTLQNGQQRALSSILQNAIDAWRSAMGRELPPVNE